MAQPAYSKLEYDPNAGKEDGPENLGIAQRRNYDMCMVFKYKTSSTVRYEENSSELLVNRVLAEPNEEAKSKMHLWKQRRDALMKSLQNCGLNLFCYYSRDRDEILVKIGASAQKLKDTAARMKYKLQLKKQFLNAYAEYRHDFPGRPERQFKDRRVISHIYKTHTEDDFPDSDAIFKTLDKIYIIHHIITSKDKDCAGINVANLLHNQELRGYFPLEEKHVLDELNEDKIQWFLMGEETANKIRDYFGDRIAFYFLFMAFYWKWLIPISLIGLFLQLIDAIAQTPDNITAIPFCILMGIWSNFLPYFWRRQEAKYAIGWGTLDMVDSLEPCRPEYHGDQRINPVTNEVENYYPWQKRIWQYMFSGVIIVFSGVILCFTILMLLLCRHRYASDAFSGLTYQFLLAMFVEITNWVLTQLAFFLTTRENHRTQSEHEMHMLAKVMGFKFLNSYFALYYIAFFEKHTYLFGVPMNCMRDDCFLDLQSQLAMFVFFRLTISNLVEHLYPKISLWFRSFFDNKVNCLTYLHGWNGLLELADMSPAEQQGKKDHYDAFADFDETLITHGYATLFAVVSPWVCIATLFGTIAEIYLDMKNLIEARQRPLPQRARNNEPWTMAFDIYGVMATATNIILLIFASQQYESWTLTEKLILFVFLAHTIFIARMLLKLVFPALPKNVELLQLKQDNMVHRCLENIKVEQNQDFSMFRENKGDHIEVFEHDYLEEDDVEPTLSLRESGMTMVDGVMEVVRKNGPRK